jgi:hypothetical protein
VFASDPITRRCLYAAAGIDCGVFGAIEAVRKVLRRPFRQIADESAVQKNGNVFDVIAISFLRSDDPGCQPTIR